jgi:hypothetical protein
MQYNLPLSALFLGCLQPNDAMETIPSSALPHVSYANDFAMLMPITRGKGPQHQGPTNFAVVPVLHFYQLHVLSDALRLV